MPTIFVPGLPGVIWLSESGKQIRGGIWAYARFSWGSRRAEVACALEALMGLADQLGCRISNGSVFLSKAEVERFVGSFERSAGTVANLLPQCRKTVKAGLDQT